MLQVQERQIFKNTKDDKIKAYFDKEEELTKKCVQRKWQTCSKDSTYLSLLSKYRHLKKQKEMNFSQEYAEFDSLLVIVQEKEKILSEEEKLYGYSIKKPFIYFERLGLSGDPSIVKLIRQERKALLLVKQRKYELFLEDEKWQDLFTQLEGTWIEKQSYIATIDNEYKSYVTCLLYTSPSPRDRG